MQQVLKETSGQCNSLFLQTETLKRLINLTIKEVNWKKTKALAIWRGTSMNICSNEHEISSLNREQNISSPNSRTPNFISII